MKNLIKWLLFKWKFRNSLGYWKWDMEKHYQAKRKDLIKRGILTK